MADELNTDIIYKIPSEPFMIQITAYKKFVLDFFSDPEVEESEEEESEEEEKQINTTKSFNMFKQST